MNSLIYMPLEKAVKIIKPEPPYENRGFGLVDGTVVVAPVANIEQRGSVDPDVALVEEHAASTAWKRTYGDGGIYHYELLIARQGITEITDANGDPCGFIVNGANRQCA